MVRLFRGWSTRGRMFTRNEFNMSHLKNNTGISYATYVKSFKRQLKNPKLRRNLFG